MTTATDLLLSISTFAAPATTTVKPDKRALTWSGLTELLSNHEQRSHKDGRGWSFATYDDGTTRAGKNVKAIGGVGGDVDHVSLEVFEQIRQRLEALGLAYALYSTYSNAPPDDMCFRVAIPFATPMERRKDEAQAAFLNRWRVVWHNANHDIFGGRLDPQTKDLSRMLYLPTAPPGVAVFAQRGEGTPLEWASLPTAPTRNDSESPGEPTRGSVDYLGYGALHFVANGAPKGEQRGNALAATRAYLAAGFSVEDTAAKVWQGLQNSTCADPHNPWKHEHALEFARDLSKREPTPLPTEEGYDLGDLLPEGVSSIGYRTNGASRNGNSHIPHAESPAADGNGSPSKLPNIIVSNRPLRDVTQDAMDAVIVGNDPPSTFVRSGDLTRVREDELGRPIIESLGESHLRGVMARTADYYKRGLDKKTNAVTHSHVPPPIDVVKDALALASWDLPPLEAVVESPTLRANGSILAIPGYDPATRLIYHPATRLTVSTVPEHPTSNDIARARDWIEEAIGEFPYADEASKANAVGTMLTPILRPALRGHTPLALFDKPRAGTGSSLLADAIALIATGRAAGMMTAPRREEEWKKSILAILVNGSTVITIDNIEHQLVSASLASAITTHYVEDRVLGQTAMIRAPQRATWIATGNNIRLGGDMPRRCYWVRMDAKSARPWERTGFKHTDLAGWVLEYRGELLGALLTLARGWYAAGKPAAAVPVMGSFEEWSKTVGGVLEHAGIHGFLSNLNELWDQADESAGQWEVFLLRWHAEFADRPVTVADICTAIDNKDREGQSIRDLLPDELAEAAGDAVFGPDNEIKPPKTGFRRQLGRALERRADTIYGDHQIVRNGKHSNTKAGLWKVVAVSLAVSPDEGDLTL